MKKVMVFLMTLVMVCAMQMTALAMDPSKDIISIGGNGSSTGPITGGGLIIEDNDIRIDVGDFSMDQITSDGDSSSVPVKGTYIPGIEGGTVYSVDIQWTAMNFVYKAQSSKVWNPTILKYIGNDTDAAWTTESVGTITISNRSNTAVTVIPTYQPGEGFATADMQFDKQILSLYSADDGNGTGTVKTGSITVTPTGYLTETATGDTIGTIALTIHGASRIVNKTDLNNLLSKDTGVGFLDAEVSSSVFSTSSTQMILDLNGNSIVADSSAFETWGLEHLGGSLSIFDGKGSGSIGMDVTNCLDSSMMIHGGTYKNRVRNMAGTMKIYNGIFEGTVYNSYTHQENSDVVRGQLHIYGGTIYGNLESTFSDTYIYGGTFNNVINMEKGVITINNGRFLLPVSNKSDGSIVIYDGTFENRLSNEGSGSIKIYGGRYRYNPGDFLGEGCSVSYDDDQSMWVVTKH